MKSGEGLLSLLVVRLTRQMRGIIIISLVLNPLQSLNKRDDMEPELLHRSLVRDTLNAKQLVCRLDNSIKSRLSGVGMP